MDLVLIPDKFKGALPADRVCEAIEAGVRSRYPQARFRRFAASDGGDGFLDAVGAVRDLTRYTEPVSDPLGRPILADYLYDPAGREAFVELAQASGLVLLSEAERDPLRTTTLGTGELIRAALERGARTVYVGLGGSATNDAGRGIAEAFGYRFLDEDGNPLEPVGANLLRVARIGLPERSPLPEGARVVAVNDVTNPLWGSEGAAHTYGPQKGAGPLEVALLDRGLRHLDEQVHRQLGVRFGPLAGSGAAGGAAYGLKTFLKAEFVSGTDYVIQYSGLADSLGRRPADLLITGEGRIDSQSLSGKFIQGVLRLGQEHGIPVLAVCGRSELDSETLGRAGFEAVLEVADPRRPLAWNLENAYTCIRETVAAYFEKAGRAG
ncbi:MAG TPA: glycerate kinase [Robiginitalea sp.]|nr:glycerate kinase [Robiginitalea sp.]